MRQNLRFVCVLAVLAIDTTAWAGEQRPVKAGPGGVAWQSAYLQVPGYWMLGTESVQKEIGLTAEQKEKLQKISKKYQERTAEQYKEYQKTESSRS